ncbi:MAG TPA: alpha/beta hydrolase-fold protein [Sedimentisphaerales bacterium]|jgi:enterochelin esterase family protein|nr:alpha/beta hydrolase-fold protein [Sedimentisphaerales bacterium]HNU29058.1 alpha/beta hydrolase-fold protein [Sedimentisphaerales bacterium]
MKCVSSVRLAVAVLLLCSARAWVPKAAAQAPAMPQMSQRPQVIVSPEVQSDHRVVFRILAVRASEVTLRGDWVEGPDLKMTKDEQGVWSATVGPLVPDLYCYWFTVDGVRIIDPRNPLVKQGVNSVDSMFFVPGEEAAFEDNQAVPHGQIRQVWYFSKTLDAQRRMHVYTPPGYDAGSERYPVFYLLHGGGDEDSGWSTIGRAGFILDNLIAAGKAKPMIVVMPNGSLPRPSNLPAFTPGTQPSPEAAAAMAAARTRFVGELMDEVIPCVEKSFRVLADREHRAIAGLSMGGGQTLLVATARPGQFAYVGVWSAGIGQNAEEWESQNAAFLDNPRINEWIKRFSIRVGDKDFALNGSKSLAEVLTKHGIKNDLRTSGGGHTWINWRRYLHETAQFLFADSGAK